MSLYNNKWFKSAFLAVLLLNPFTATASIVASIRPLGFIAAAIADGITPVDVLLPDGASPHQHALRPSDMVRLKQAELIIWVGPEMEVFLTEQLKQHQPEKQIALAKLPEIMQLLKKGHQCGCQHGVHKHQNSADGTYDMHIWLSPEIAKLAAQSIYQALLVIMPSKKAFLDKNLQYFKDKLTQTKKNIAKILKPVQGKRYFVFHDAYGYFETKFNMQSLGHFTINPEIPPGAQRLLEIKTKVAQGKATCIFSEPQFSPEIVKSIALGSGVRIGELDPVGIGIPLNKDSYMNFLLQLSQQYRDCLG